MQKMNTTLPYKVQIILRYSSKGSQLKPISTWVFTTTFPSQGKKKPINFIIFGCILNTYLAVCTEGWQWHLQDNLNPLQRT